MARNSLYPGFVRVQYTSVGHVHYQTLPVKPYTGIGGAWWLTTPGTPGNDDVWTVKVEQYVVFMKAMFPTSATITKAELWTLDAPTSDPVFRESYDIGVPGTNGATTYPNVQVVLTTRTDVGGILRMYWMEGVANANVETFPPAFTGLSYLNAFNVWLTGANNFICGRDGGWPIAAIRALSKTNDALRKSFVLS